MTTTEDQKRAELQRLKIQRALLIVALIGCTILAMLGLIGILGVVFFVNSGERGTDRERQEREAIEQQNLPYRQQQKSSPAVAP